MAEYTEVQAQLAVDTAQENTGDNYNIGPAPLENNLAAEKAAQNYQKASDPAFGKIENQPNVTVLQSDGYPTQLAVANVKLDPADTRAEAIAEAVVAAVGEEPDAVFITTDAKQKTGELYEFKLNIDAQGLGPNSSFSADIGDDITLPLASIYTASADHTLVGFNTASDGSGTAYAFGATFAVEDNSPTQLYVIEEPTV